VPPSISLTHSIGERLRDADMTEVTKGGVPLALPEAECRPLAALPPPPVSPREPSALPGIAAPPPSLLWPPTAAANLYGPRRSRSTAQPLR